MKSLFRKALPGFMPCVLAAVMSCLAPSLWAFEYSWNDIDIEVGGRVSLGATWRMEERENALIGKLNVPGQQNLCAQDDCLDLGGDPEPNQRLVDAEGAFLGWAFDDGNLNYDQYDVTAAALKLNTDLTAIWKDFRLKFSGVGFYDPVNKNAFDRHTNTIHQPAKTRRPKSVDRDIGADVDLLEAFVSTHFELWDRTVNFSLGSQYLRWGESNFIALNSINEINPPDENRVWIPGADFTEAYQPIPLVVFSADLTQDISAEFFYQLKWKPARAAATGGFMSLFEAANGKDWVLLTQSQTPEDPNREHRLSGLGGVVTDSSATAQVLDGFGDASDSGQFGLKVSWYTDALLGGTELAFFAMNYHSRIPYLGMVAGEDSCARESGNLVEAIADCPLLISGSLDLRNIIFHYLGEDVGEILPPVDLELSGGQDALPFDTPKIFLDYPEDIQLYGVSFNTTYGGWSLSGEYAYRPNMPLQVSLTDVVMAGSQPLFPREDIVVGVPQLATLPAARRFIPDFLSVYRGYDNSIPERSIQEGQIVRGFERLNVGQLDITGIKVFSPSDIPFPLGAEQVILFLETGFTHVEDMPDQDELQFEGYILHKNTHASPGADGTGAGGVPDLRLNPTQQTEGFADDFAWGYRVNVLMEYNDLFWGINFRPWLIFGHDVKGISPLPKSGYQGFAEGRKFFQVGSEFTFRENWSGGLFYRGSTGDNDTMRDRDHLTAHIAYSF